MSLRVKLSIPVAPRDGYGSDGIGLAQAFMRQGIDVYLDPAYVQPPLPQDVANILTKDFNPPYDIHIKHVNPVALKLTEQEKQESYKCLAWSMWEQSSFSEDKAPKVKDALDDYLKILAYDDISKEAFESTGTTTPVSILQGGYDPRPWAPTEHRPLAQRDWHSEEFVFVMAGSITPRKDPYVALKALSKLYDEGYKVKFYIKTLIPGTVPHLLTKSYPFLRIVEGAWTQEQMRTLYESAHCYLGPSWGEGKNLPALEAGTTGTALILSDCGGHRGWARPEIATLVGGQTVTYDGETSLRVDVDLLADACRDLIENRNKARQMGEMASQILPYTMSWDRVAEDLLLIHARG